MTTLTGSDIKARTRVSRHLWARWLLTALAGCEILMAAGAAPLLMAAGGLGGAALVVAAWVPTNRRPSPGSRSARRRVCLRGLWRRSAGRGWIG